MSNTKEKKMRVPRTVDIHYSEIYELAAYMTGVYDDPDRNDGTVEQRFQEEFGADTDALNKIVNVLLPMAMRGRGLVGAYAAFAIIDKKGDAEAVVHVEVDANDQLNHQIK